MMIIIAVQFNVAAGKAGAFIQEAKPLIEATRGEAGCVSYVLHQDIKNPEQLLLIEHWQDQASLDVHMRSPHYTKILPKLGAFYTAPPTIHLYQEVKS